MIAHTKHQPTGTTAQVSYTVHPDDLQTFIDAVVPHIATTAQLDGCIYYVWAQDLTDPNTIHLSEAWRDQASMEALHATEEFRAVMRTIRSDVRLVGYQAEGYEIASQTRFDSPPSPR